MIHPDAARFIEMRGSDSREKVPESAGASGAVSAARGAEPPGAPLPQMERVAVREAVAKYDAEIRQKKKEAITATERPPPLGVRSTIELDFPARLNRSVKASLLSRLATPEALELELG